MGVKRWNYIPGCCCGGRGDDGDGEQNLMMPIFLEQYNITIRAWGPEGATPSTNTTAVSKYYTPTPLTGDWYYDVNNFHRGTWKLSEIPAWEDFVHNYHTPLEFLPEPSVVELAGWKKQVSSRGYNTTLFTRYPGTCGMFQGGPGIGESNHPIFWGCEAPFNENYDTLDAAPGNSYGMFASVQFWVAVNRPENVPLEDARAYQQPYSSPFFMPYMEYSIANDFIYSYGAGKYVEQDISVKSTISQKSQAEQTWEQYKAAGGKHY